MIGIRNNQRLLSFSKSLAVILLLSGLFLAYVLIKPVGHQTLTLLDNLLQGLLEGVGVVLTCPLWLPRSGHMGLSPPSLLRGKVGVSSMQHWFPLLLGLGILSYVIGQAIWTYNEDIVHLPVLFPSWADAGYLGSYPFVLFAIFFLPRHRLQAQTRVRFFLDGLITMVAIVTFSWYFVLGPTMLRGSNTPLGQVIGTAYPLTTLVLIFCLLYLSIREYDRELQAVVLLLSLALTVIVITDSVYDYQELHNLYMTGGFLDVGWPLGYMLVGLSGRAMWLHLALNTPSPVLASVSVSSSKQSVGRSSSLWQASFPLLFVPAVLALLIWAEYRGDNPALKPMVIAGVIILLALMMVRQVLVTQEIISQNHMLQRMRQDAQARNDALLRANEQLEEQARIEGAYARQLRLNDLKDQFILNVSHELRTPLTQVSGYLEMLGMYHRDLTSDKLEQYILQAMQGCDDLLQLINTVLDATTAETFTSHLQKRQVQVKEVIHEVIDQFEPQQRQVHPLALELAEGLAVQADPHLLRQVLRNLLSNAFKYSPAQSPVRIVATRAAPSASHRDHHSHICICVQDRGPGIASDDIPLLFGRFVRLERDLAGPIRGTGLGLFICKQLVEAMNGRIWVESSGIAGQGSCFFFTLPACDQPREAQPGG